MIEKEFLDRVPTYPGRVTLTPVAGQANTYDMARSDSPRVAGTPLDKATFDSVVQSRLTGRYYEPTCRKDEVGSYTGVTTNPIPTTWYKETSGRAYSGIWVVTSAINDNSEVYRAVDGEETTRWVSAMGTTHDFIIDTGSVLTVKKMLLNTAAINGTYATVTISGSNDGAKWTTLYAVSNVDKIEKEITLTTNGAYKLYRVSFVNSLSNVSASIWEWAFTEYDFKTYTNSYTISSGVPTEWTTGQKVTIQVPADTNNLAVISNTLNGVTVNTILQPNKRYELRYTGSAFVAKEV